MPDKWSHLPPEWSAPIATRFTALHKQARLGSVPSVSSVSSAIADLFHSLDKAALAAFFEHAMGGFAMAGVLSSRLSAARSHASVAALSADDLTPDEYNGESVAFAPFEDAIRRLSVKSPLASPLRSAQWAMVPAELKNRAQFSAGVESAVFLQEIQNRVMDRLSGRENDPDEFVYQMRKIADDVGLPYTSGGDYGTIKDIRSLPRMRLVYETQNAMAAEYARRKADLDPDAMDLYPAYELTRVEGRRVPRDEMHPGFWAGRWSEAGNSCGWIGAATMPHVALKTSPIWQALGALGPFGNPHPPFEWGSGMGTIDVPREQCESLGLLTSGGKVPASDEPGFNEDLGASTADISPDLRGMLSSWLGDKVHERDGKLMWN